MTAIQIIGRIAVAVFLMGLAEVSFAQNLKGMALVIGQSKYESIPSLGNAARDAGAMAGLLEDLGFDVTLATDRDFRRLSRDLSNFVADAADAAVDVAIVYYAGHGIEAGGENYLVATDTSDGEGLVPVSQVLAELRATVPLSIVLLDACRTNPFPHGIALKIDGKATPVSVAGLGVSRGFGQAVSDSPRGIGMVIGFAAAPGAAAVDGEPGSNSPYTTALLRHLSALAGNEFGQVMRMVTEEVYLKTQGRQRPWVNETLTKFLYFGTTPETKDALQSKIDGERRPLLLMIADLPFERRQQIEDLSTAKGVPLDTLYGVLRALGESEVPQDGESLERLLVEKAEQLREFRVQGQALASDDPEVRRLSEAAEQALSEGALAAARDFLDTAKQRIARTRATLDRLSDALRAKRIANAAIFAQSAEAAILSFDYRGAADDYGEAYAWVKEADPVLSFTYRRYQGNWLVNHGEESGETSTIAEGVRYLEDVASRIPPETLAEDWAAIHNDLAAALRKLGEIRGDAALVARAIEAYEAALTIRTRTAAPEAWADTQMNLGNAMVTLGVLTGDSSGFPKAVSAYLSAQDVYTRDKHPMNWAKIETNLGTVLKVMGDRSEGTLYLERSVEAFEAVLAMRDRREAPLPWAMAQGDLGAALSSLGDRQGSVETLRRAAAAYEAALSELPKEIVPARWARVQNNLGDVLVILGLKETGTATLERALAVLSDSLAVRNRDAVPMSWALTTANIGRVMGHIGERRSDAALVAAAIAKIDTALDAFTRERTPSQWNMVSRELARLLLISGKSSGDRAALERGLKVLRDVEAFNLKIGRDDARVPAAIAEFEAALKSTGN